MGPRPVFGSIKRGLHWVAWEHSGIPKYGIGLILGRAPLAQVTIVVDLELAKAGEVTKPFVMNPDAFIDCKKLDIDWELAPDRIKKLCNQPTRVPKEKDVKDA